MPSLETFAFIDFDLHTLEHRLRELARERPQPRALTTREDHGLHRATSRPTPSGPSTRAARPSRNARRASGTYFAAA